jgi:hypothetical protein
LEEEEDNKQASKETKQSKQSTDGGRTHNVVPARHPHAAVDGDGDARGVGQDELDLVEPPPAPQVLHRPRPALARVAEAVGEDDRRRVLARRREAQGAAVAGRHLAFFFFTFLAVDERAQQSHFAGKDTTGRARRAAAKREWVWSLL